MNYGESVLSGTAMCKCGEPYICVVAYMNVAIDFGAGAKQ